MNFYDAYELGLCSDCDKDPIACEACNHCKYSGEEDDE